jgi:hypothetical protein
MSKLTKSMAFFTKRNTENKVERSVSPLANRVNP